MVHVPQSYHHHYITAQPLRRPHLVAYRTESAGSRDRVGFGVWNTSTQETDVWFTPFHPRIRVREE